jgi:transposase
VRIATDRPQAPTAIRTNLGAIFLSMEISRTTWLLTSLSELCGKVGDEGVI